MLVIKRCMAYSNCSTKAGKSWSMLLKLSYKPQLESRRDFSSGRNRTGADAPLKLDVHARVTAWMRSEGPNGSRNKEVRKRSGALVKPSQDKMSVHHAGPADAKLAAKGTTDPLSDDVSAETWQLFNEYNVPNTLEKIFGVLIRATESPSKQIQLTLYGRNTAKVWRMLVNPSLKLHVHKRVTAWLLAEGLNGLRVKDILRKFDTHIDVGPYKDHDDPDQMVDLTVIGEHEENVEDVLTIVGGLHLKRRLIKRAKYFWLIHKSKGARYAREEDLERKFYTCIVLRQRSDGDTVGMVDLAVVGEREENVDEVLAIIDGLCVKRRLISRELYLWLVSKAKGAECAREMDLERKFDTCILLYPLDDKDDPSCIVELVVLGEREENVDEVFAAIAIAAPDS